MIRTFFWYVSGWITLMLTYPVLITAIFLKKLGLIKDKYDFADKIAKRLARTLFYLTGSSLQL